MTPSSMQQATCEHSDYSNLFSWAFGQAYCSSFPVPSLFSTWAKRLRVEVQCIDIRLCLNSARVSYSLMNIIIKHIDFISHLLPAD